MLWALVACGTSEPDRVSSEDCLTWPVQIGDAPNFGAGDAVGEPRDWELDTIRTLPVTAGHVQGLSVDLPHTGDFLVDGGLWLESFWGPGLDVVYDSPLLLWSLPLEGSWSGEATFRDGLIGGLIQQGVDRWEAQIVDIVDLELDGLTFLDVRRVEITMTRTLTVSTGDTETERVAWVSPCHGVIAWEEEGRGTRLVP